MKICYNLLSRSFCKLGNIKNKKKLMAKNRFLSSSKVGLSNFKENMKLSMNNIKSLDYILILVSTLHLLENND